MAAADDAARENEVDGERCHEGSWRAAVRGMTAPRATGLAAARAARTSGDNLDMSVDVDAEIQSASGEIDLGQRSQSGGRVSTAGETMMWI